MVHHLQDATGDRLLRERERAQHHEAEVRHRRVRDEPLDVGLDQRADRPVDDPDHGQDRDEGREVPRGLGEQRQVEPDQTVRPDLQQDRRQEDGTGGGRLGVCIGQPGVEGDERHLHREGHEEREEQGPRRADRERVGDRGQRPKIERALAQLIGCLRVEHDGRHEQERGPRHGEQEELDGGVDAALATPATDQQVHRHEHRLEEHEEQQEVERHEGAEHGRFQGEHRRHVAAHVALHAPRRQDRHGEQEGGQQDQPQADAVDPEDVGQTRRLRPDGFLDELVRAGRPVEGRPGS